MINVHPNIVTALQGSSECPGPDLLNERERLRIAIEDSGITFESHFVAYCPDLHVFHKMRASLHYRFRLPSSRWQIRHRDSLNTERAIHAPH